MDLGIKVPCLEKKGQPLEVLAFGNGIKRVYGPNYFSNIIQNRASHILILIIEK